MNIYFTASFSAGRGYLKNYKKIISLLKNSHNQVFGEQLLLEKSEINGDEKKAAEIFSREKKRIEEADLIVAEVSEPSLGVGSEIAYALTLDKPVLTLFYKDSVNRLSPMISGNPSDSLYIEHYDDDDLKIVLKKFLAFLTVQKKKKGKLIVLEGGDGSGKTTQTKLLVEHLKKKNIKVKQIEFPRYYTSFHGEIVARFQRGEFGTINSVSPYLISLAYALDRLSMREEIVDLLNRGYYIIANRYVTSSLAHQAAKLQGFEKEKFIEWLDELEYRVHKMPREDLVIYLHVPWKTGMELSKNKNDKTYLNGGKDISEENKKHLRETEKMYKFLAKKKKNWRIVECIKNARLKTKEEIKEEICGLIN